MRRHDLLSSTIFFCFGLSVVLYSPRFDLGTLSSPGAGFMPFLSGLIICGFASVIFFLAFFDKSGGIEKIWSDVHFGKLVFLILTVIGYALLMEPLGFIICSFFLILLLMRYIGLQTWIKSILGAVLSSILSYLLFDMWLEVQLPKGILGFLR